mgnify:CR=1 FL=1
MRKIIVIILVASLFLAACATTQIKSVADVITAPEKYVDKGISVQGAVVIDNRVKCTLQVCPEDNACCQTCSADLLLSSGDALLRIKGGTCFGNNCGMSCAPLEQNKKYVVSGILRQENSEYHLELADYKEAANEE